MLDPTIQALKRFALIALCIVVLLLTMSIYFCHESDLEPVCVNGCFVIPDDGVTPAN